MSDPIERIKRLDDVMYVAEYDGHYRVVFKHDADSTAIHEAERHTGCAGRLGATQEHNPCVEYPIEKVDA
mgnify:CR=1 FL=1